MGLIMTDGTRRRSAAIAALLCSAFSTSALAEERPFRIAAEDASVSLMEFGRQAGLQILFASDRVKGFKTHAVNGSYEPIDAIRLLIKDTGLRVSEKDGGVLVVEPRSENSAPTKTSSTGATAPAAPPLVAQSGAQSSSSVESSPATSDKEKARERLEEVVVTGSRIPLGAGQQQVQPVRSYSREDIANSGQSTIGEFLNTLPDVSAFTNSTTQLGLAGAQTVQLHGLPIGTTLTLLDGRRLETNIGGFFDLSNIPISAVERIEILPVGASAIYGADGLAGAVNTILRKNFNGFEATATLDHAPGVNDPGVNLAWGKSWERGSISLIGSFQRRGELLGTQREPTSLTHVPANLPASTALVIESDSCAPGNVYSLDGSNLPGLSSSQAGIPAGIAGVPTVQQFAASAGKLNVCNQAQYGDITPQSQREGALLSAHDQVAESVDLFAEVLLSHAHLKNQVTPQIQAFSFFNGTVAANNPYNPFGQAVNVSFAYPGAGAGYVQSTSLIRPMIGIRGSFLSDWHYEVSAYLSRDQLHLAGLAPDLQKISDALSSSDPATALNPFTSGAPGTPQLLNSLIDPAVDSFGDTYDDRIASGQAILRGPLLRLPAGALQAVIGSDYSQERQDSTFVGAPPYFLHRNTYAVFSEARVPLLAGGEPPQRGERLALTLAGRYDHSNDYGGKATWQSGLLWRTTETLSLSGAYGLSYQAPQLPQISGPQFVSVGPLVNPDPFRGNQPILYPVKQVFGPNFNLKPETGDSLTLGFGYSSQSLPGLHASLTWYSLKISNYIGLESTGNLLAYPNLFPGAVVRAPATPQDQQQGFLGVITQLNNNDYNFGDLRVAGFDADLSYPIDTRIGQFTPSLAIANVYKWQSALLPSTPAIDAVSKATISIFGGGVGWAPRWKGTAALAWKQGPLSMNLAGRYLGRYLDYQEFVPNTHETGNSWIFDFNAQYEVRQTFAGSHSSLAHAYVALGAVNVFNKTPPFSYTPYWYDLQSYDIRGRYLHLSVGARF